MSGMYLIQRLQTRGRPEPRRGFDGVFRLEYMGSAEYEFGTPNAALRSIRSEGPLAGTAGTFEYRDMARDVHFVGRPSALNEGVDAFAEWFHDPNRRNQENPRFHEHFTRAFAFGLASTDAWWSFDDDIAWALDADTAALLRRAFDARRPS